MDGLQDARHLGCLLIWQGAIGVTRSYVVLPDDPLNVVGAT